MNVLLSIFISGKEPDRNLISEKKLQVHAGRKRISELCCSTVWGFFFIYSGKVSARFVVALIVTV